MYQSGRRYKAKLEGRGGGLFHGWHKNKHLTDSHARSANDAMRIRTGTVFSILLKYPSRYIHVAVGTLDWLPPEVLTVWRLDGGILRRPALRNC